jgi:hypothetical protein
VTPSPPDRLAGRLRRKPVLAGGLCALIVLLLCWPFVREPPLGLQEIYLHLVGTWCAAILLSWWLSRGLAPGRDERGPP